MKINDVDKVQGRSPHGERGLKYGSCLESRKPYWSLPSRGAWIEIALQGKTNDILASLPSRGAWIEIRMRGVPRIRT